MAESIWELLDAADAARKQLPQKLPWRLLRQFQSPEQIEQEFDSVPQLLWSVRRKHEDVGSTKLLLSRAGVRCEAVALFPGASRRSGAAEIGAAQAKLPRATACISSQPGCGVGCPFCATGELGYRGNLTAYEIVEQVYWAGLEAARANYRLRNVVFMGMGEPLHNLQHVEHAIGLLTAVRLFGFPQRRIMVSTAGVPAGMVRLASRFPELRLALSLHTAEPELRRELVPRAVGDLQRLRSAIRQVNQRQPRHPVWLEIVLFAGVNDSIEQAQLLIEFCRDLRVEVNLIPYNSAARADVFRPSGWEVREAFAEHLRAAGIRTTIRYSLGQSTQAACGQLNAFDPDDCVAK